MHWLLFLTLSIQAQSPQIFAPGEISGPANDGPPAFSPDGNTIFFTRSTQQWGAIFESHKVNGRWSKPALAPFSGEWPDSSPSMAPDGSYLVFQSKRDKVSSLWRVDRIGSGWSKPVRLPDAVNIGKGIWKPSVAADGTIYFVSIDEKRNKRLYSSAWKNGSYQQAQPLSFSDGTTLDVDPEIAPDGSFLVFCSAGRIQGDQKDHLFIVVRKGADWGPVTPMHYDGDAPDSDDDPHLGRDRRTIYFSSDRVIPVEFPRSFEQAKKDVESLDRSGWFSGYANVWSLDISPWLK
jgi:Tol biopolymer transport system component